MMKKVREMNYDEFQLSKKPDFKLRVGVCTGKVIAGVVGNQKPLYDIWGDTVNIASRMDYTGERGEIHVPEATARHLMNLDPVTGTEVTRSEVGYCCDLSKVMCRKRGDIKVKGKGIMTTYYVDLTEDLDVVEKTYSDELLEEFGVTLTNGQIERYIDEEEEDNVFPEVFSKIDIKKDSGFGSQGHLEVGKVKVRSNQNMFVNSVSFAKVVQAPEENHNHEDEDVEPEPVVQGKLSKQELSEHYENYETSNL